MTFSIIGILAFAGAAVSSPLISLPGFLPVQQVTLSSIETIALATSSPAPVVSPDAPPRIKVTINLSSKTPSLPTSQPVDTTVNAVFPVSTSTLTTATASTSVEISALVGVVAASSTTTTSSKTVAVVVPSTTSSHSAAFVVVQPSTTPTLSSTSGSTTAVTSAAVAATPSASTSSFSARPFTIVFLPVPVLPFVSSSSATPIVVVTPTAVSTSSNSSLFLQDASFTVPPTTIITPTSASTSTTAIQVNSTTTTTPRLTVSTINTSTGPSDPKATSPLLFDELVETVKLHTVRIINISRFASLNNKKTSDRLDETIQALNALSNEFNTSAKQIAENFFEIKNAVGTLANQTTDRSWEVNNAFQLLSIRVTKELEHLKASHEEQIKGLVRAETLKAVNGSLSDLIESKGKVENPSVFADLKLLAQRVVFLENENWKWNHADRQDPVETRLEALEAQNTFLKQKLEQLLGAGEDDPEQDEEHPEEEHYEETPQQPQAQEPDRPHWPEWFEGVWNGESSKKH
ncbi:hypothetical protein P171DRAFT_487002 [Karstenula rhodostoma CBS 690.94]|uniref:Uncharacterized protein n=1 Tax=Karstenula rhodostoma CBS 690.94 TaxID=1392251 RepID=A0A9P4UAA9_9PLEO|nr:hypothetical protein P171DRAFT_487002 [Karstenula rhodostoma CBS 690.94]